MNLREKIAQMLMLDLSFRNNASGNEEDSAYLIEEIKKFIKRYKIGGVVLFGKALQDNEKAFRLICEMQEAATSKDAINRVPLLMAVDQEGGKMVRLKQGVSMPGACALGAINDEEVTEECASILAKEIKSLGFNVNFAPVVDVNNNPNNPVIGTRSFSSDPNMVSKHGLAYVKGTHAKHIACCLKHFPGHGDTGVDSHTGLPSISKTYDELRSLELIPYVDIFKEEPDMIMTAHILYPMIEKQTYTSILTGEEITLPATLSKKILTDILRKDLGFNGVVVTDALVMDAISKHFNSEDVARLAINAGANILLMPFKISSVADLEKLEVYIESIYSMVYSGVIPIERIDESVARILKLKQKLGLLSKGKDMYEDIDEIRKKITFSRARLKKAQSVIDCEEHKEKEYKFAKKAITLIKNDGALPIKENRVLVFVSNEEELKEISYPLTTIQRCFKEEEFTVEGVILSDVDSNKLHELISMYDCVISTFNVSRTEELIPDNEEGQKSRLIDEIIAEAHKQKKKVIVISTWLPYNIARVLEADAIVCCYGERENKANFNGNRFIYSPNLSAAMLKLFSDKKYKGKLPMTIYSLDENYCYSNRILYEIGYGLDH